MDRSWSVGKGPENDVVVDRQTVSGRHCRLTRTGGEFFVEDVGSTNGTYVNGVKITGRVRVTRGDAITLGAVIPMPWPEEQEKTWARVVRIGREEDNDVVINLPIVSGHHARVVWDGGPEPPFLEDLDSANGTALGSPDRKIKRSELKAGDTIFLGSHPLAAAMVLWKLDAGLVPKRSVEGNLLVIGTNPSCEHVIDHPAVADRHASLVRVGGSLRIEDLGSNSGTFVNGGRIEGETTVRSGDLIGLGAYAFVLDDRGGSVEADQASLSSPSDPMPTPAPVATMAADSRVAEKTGEIARKRTSPWPVIILLGQILAISMLIVALAKRGGESPKNLATSLFLTGLAAIWSGLAGAVVGKVDARRVGSIAVAAGMALGQCVILWLVVSIGVGLKGPAAPTLGILAVASGLGMAMGLVVAAVVSRTTHAWAAVAALVAILWIFGGNPWPGHSLPAPARLTCEALPSRWAFEGLLLLEADGTPGGDDLVEPYFPSESARMGVSADAIALLAMLIGWSGLAAVIVWEKRPAVAAS